MAYEGIDAASLELIIKLQLSDVKRLIKGKGKEGETPDGELAADMYESELESVARCHSDRVMCRSIARAVQLDADIIRHHTELESQAACDRQRILGRAQPTITQDQALPEIDDRVLSRLKAMSLFNDNDESTLVGNSAESSSWAASRPRTSTTLDTPQKCIACGSALATDQAIHCPCSHDYCVECLEGLVRAAIADEAFFPPRCCKQPIPIQTTETVLASTIVGELRVKEVEYGTPNRIYCHVPTCSAFITPESIKNDVATCSECSAQTCSICKGSTHTSDCPEDKTTQELLRIATENGWQRCRTCHRIVELDFGCNHMTCLCGTQFCYVCGDPWKDCKCPQWHENNLLARANVNVNRNNRGRPVDAARRQALVERERRNLIENHQCTHERWTKLHGAYRCEECRDMLKIFIYQCRQCNVLSCHCCRYNRL